jgi:serine/threonine protein kinase
VKSVGRYDILQKLGQGGMGTVYKAFDPLLTRVVAIKVISAQLDSQPEHRERFFREARAAAQLSHRNIITIHDLGEHEGSPFLAMEYLEGRDLDRRLKDREPMSLAQKLELALSIGEGICHAHACGVVHRDIKPANVFVTNDGLVKILDFGLARLVSSDMTRTGLMVGTVNYMAPEQLRGEKSDHRADIFAYGVLFYELLAGRRPFQGDSAASTMYKILHDAPEPLSVIDPTLPATLTTLVDRAMAKARDDRYQHMTDLLRDLDAAFEAVSGSARRTQNRTVSVARAISDPAAVTRAVPPVEPSQKSSDETVPVADAWKLAVGSLPHPATVPEPGPPQNEPRAATPAPAPLSPVPAVVAPAPRPASRVVAITAVAVLAALGGIGIYSLRRPAPTTPVTSVRVNLPEPPAPARVPAPTVTPAPHAPTPAPEPTPGARSPKPVPAAPSTARTADRDHERAAQQARQATLEADRQRAAAALTAVEAAKANADTAGARDLAAGLYSAAERQEALARDDLRQERYPAAASRLDATVSLYRSAESAARTEADARATHARQEETRKREEASRAAAPPVAPAPRVEPPPKPEPPPAPPVQSGPSAQDQITAVVERYRAALEQRSVAALKAVWPGLSGAQQTAIESEFANARAIEVQLASPRIQVTGTSATVVTRRQYRLRTRDGQQLSSESITTIALRQAGGTWVIESVRYQPVN